MIMKKTMMIAVLILVAAACCFAETHTITLVSRVEKQDAQFVIVNRETGKSGASVVYTTGEIARHDVSTSFDIVQSTDCNGINAVSFTVSATELVARVNGKKYSYYPEITSVKISGSWNEWDGPEMELISNYYAYLTTVNLTSLTEDQEFKLVVNGEWIGSGELVGIEGDAASSVVEGEKGTNLTLKAGKAYDIVAFWSSPSMNVKEGWLLEVTENTTTGVDGVRANAKKQTVYNLAGQRLNNTQRGVNIVNGKKVAVK